LLYLRFSHLDQAIILNKETLIFIIRL